LLQDNDFSPLKHFLADGDAERRYQLVSRLADLIDLYQVYRTDWLQDWSLGLDQLRRANGELVPLPADQRWQAKLWRAILADLPEAERLLGRVNVHRRFVDAASGGVAPATPLPRRVVYSASLRCPADTGSIICVGPSYASHTRRAQSLSVFLGRYYRGARVVQGAVQAATIA
jgi:exodeoxyribonuclease V gamma subunit